MDHWTVGCRRYRYVTAEASAADASDRLTMLLDSDCARTRKIDVQDSSTILDTKWSA